MADRVVKVSLRAEINNYLSGMEQARRKTQETGAEAEKTAAKLQAQRDAFNLLGGTLLTAGTLAAAAVGVAVKKWMDFDQAMSAVAAATHESEENLGRLRDAALEAGARTVFSATEAANAIEELGKAGLSTQDILSGGLNGALDLAAAGGLEVADAAGIAAVAVKTFGLTGRDVSHVADLLAAGAGKAMGDVQDLSQALSQGGQVAAATGLSIEETTAALAAFASQGLLGSDAGTAFKTMLQSLNPRSAEAAKLMRDLDISAYDAQGNFIGLEKFAGKLQKGLGGLTTQQRQAALATVFGSDAIRAATVLYSEGAAGIRDWEAAVDDQGYAAETAAKRLDNLRGDWEQFGGAIETAAIQAGEAADGPLRFLTQAATDAVTGFAALPAPLQQGTLAVAGLGAAAAIASGAFLVGVPKVAEYRAAVDALGISTGRAGTALRILGQVTAISTGAVAVLAIGLGIFAQKQAEAQARTDELTAALQASNGALDENVRKTVAKQLQDKGAFDAARELKVSVEDVTSAALGNEDALGKVSKRLEELDKGNKGVGSSSTILAERVQSVRNAIGDMSGAVSDSKEKLAEQAEAQGVAADGADTHSTALAALEGKAAATEDAVEGLADAIRGFGSAELDVRAATRELEAAFDDMAASIEANGDTLDVTTEAGRANESALDAIAKSALEAAAATATQTGSAEAANAVIATQRERLIGVLGQLGITGAAAQAYADKLGLIPGAVDTYVDLNTSDADAEMERFFRSWNGTTVAVNVNAREGRNFAAGGIVEYYANGGRRENHVAQIAPAGAWRVWAEPETGGEAYIPLAPEKRVRSLDVWEETGRMLGAFSPAPQPVYAKGAPAPIVRVAAPSLEGLAISGRLEIGGDGLARIVDGRISQYDRDRRRTEFMGYQGGF